MSVCRNCGRTLSAGQSLIEGIGPECIKKYPHIFTQSIHPPQGEKTQMVVEKPKGIASRKNADGTISYRVDTNINGVKMKSPWSTDLEKTRRDLEKYAQMRRATVAVNQHTVVPNNMKTSEFVDKFLERMKSRKKPHLFNRLKGDVRYLFDKYHDFNLSELNSSMIEFKNIGQGRASFIIGLIRQLNEYALSLKVPFAIDTIDLKERASILKKTQSKIEFLTDSDSALLFQYLEKNPTKSNTWFKRAIILGMYNGLRSGEVLALRKKNVDLTNNILTIESSKHAGVKNSFGLPKNGQTRKIPMSPHSRSVIEAILKERPNMGDGDLFFPRSAGTIGDKTAEMQSLNVLKNEHTFHTFRHTFASLFFKLHGTKDNSMRQLRDLMGHKSVLMTEKYVHVFESMNSDLLANLTHTKVNKIDKAKKKKEKAVVDELLEQ